MIGWWVVGVVLGHRPNQRPPKEPSCQQLGCWMLNWCSFTLPCHYVFFCHKNCGNQTISGTDSNIWFTPWMINPPLNGFKWLGLPTALSSLSHPVLYQNHFLSCHHTQKHTLKKKNKNLHSLTPYSNLNYYKYTECLTLILRLTVIWPSLWTNLQNKCPNLKHPLIKWGTTKCLHNNSVFPKIKVVLTSIAVSGTHTHTTWAHLVFIS